MSKRSNCFLFAGPTLYRSDGSQLLPAEIHLLPPVQRGDTPRLIQSEPSGVMIVADGLFHQVLAVGHVELRDAMEAGWQVWGLSSMGAIRACEMRHLGMRGFGQVYDLFVQQDDFQDDEVALLHASDPPYAPITEPLVHLRAALDFLAAQFLLSPEDACAVAADMKALWYGERFLSVFMAGVMDRAEPSDRHWVHEALADFDRFRIKTRDLETFLCRREWEAGYNPPVRVMESPSGLTDLR